MFEAEQLAEPILLCGVELPASEATMFEDLQVLSRAYAKEKPQIRYQKKPVYTMVATSSRRLFMGDVVEKKNPGRKHLQIRKGQWVVKVAIPYRMQAALPAKVARLRKQFSPVNDRAAAAGKDILLFRKISRRLPLSSCHRPSEQRVEVSRIIYDIPSPKVEHLRTARKNPV